MDPFGNDPENRELPPKEPSCPRVYKFFGSTFVRQLTLTVIPSLALLIIIIYLNSWKAREIRETTSTFLRVSGRTLADNVDNFFSEKFLFVGFMRELIRSGIWTDVTDIDTYTKQVIPILTHHPSYRALYQRTNVGATMFVHKPKTTGTVLIDLGFNILSTRKPNHVFEYTRRHHLNFERTNDRWEDWILGDWKEVPESDSFLKNELFRSNQSWYRKASNTPLRPGGTGGSGTLTKHYPYWGPPSESRRQEGISFSLRVDWPLSRYKNGEKDLNNGLFGSSFTTFRYQYDRIDIAWMMLGDLPLGTEALIFDVETQEYVMYSRITDNPFTNFGDFKPDLQNKNPEKTYNFSSALLADNTTKLYTATPIGTVNEGLSKWQLVTTNTLSTGNTDSDHATVLSRVRQVFKKLQDLGMLTEYLVHSRLIDDPEDVSELEEAFIPTFVTNPMLSLLQIVHGTETTAIEFTRTVKWCNVKVTHFGTGTPSLSMLQRRYQVGPLNDLNDWYVSPKTKLESPAWFNTAPWPGTDDGLVWETPRVDPDLCPTDDLAQCQTPEHLQESLVLPVYFAVTWPYPHDRRATTPLDRSLFAFTFAVRDLRMVLRDLDLDPIGGAAAVFNRITYQVIASSTTFELDHYALWELPSFKDIRKNVIALALSNLGTKVYVSGDMYLQALPLNSTDKFGVIFVVRERAVSTPTFERTEYYIDGLIAAVMICFAIHVGYVLIHVNDIKKVSKIIDDVADMRFDKVDALMPMSFSTCTELRRLQHSALSLRRTMERLRPFLGPLRNVHVTESSYTLNHISMRQGCEPRNICVVGICHMMPDGMAPPPQDVLTKWERIIVANNGRSYLMDGILFGLWEVDAHAPAMRAAFSIDAAGVSSGLVLVTVASGNVLVGNVGSETAKSFTLVGDMMNDLLRLVDYTLSVLTFSLDGMVSPSPGVVRLASSRFLPPSSSAAMRTLGSVQGSATMYTETPWAVKQLVSEGATASLPRNDMNSVVEFMNRGDYDGARAAMGAVSRADVGWEQIFQEKLYRCVQQRDTALINIGY